MSDFSKRASKIAEKIKENKHVTIVSHIDADGICAGSIASLALQREGIEHSTIFIKQLDKPEIERLKKSNNGLIWFTDLGSGQIPMLSDLEYVITDHHVPAPPEVKLEDRRTLLSFFNAMESKDQNHLNPHLFSKNGAQDISGAGVTYFVAKALNKKNLDLAALAVIGAVGDLQDAKRLKLTGTNRQIMKDAKEAQKLDWKMDIRFFGRETRPVYKLLRYANDPIVPGLTGSDENCIEFLRDLGIPVKNGEKWRTWVDLGHAEKQLICSEITKIMISKGLGNKVVKRVIGEVYILLQESQGTELRDAKEFATLLNACGRHAKPEVGYEVCLGDRNEGLTRAKKLLSGHRRSLVDNLQLIKDIGVTERECLQFFHGQDKVPENIVGTLAGMLLGGGEIRTDIPIIGFAYKIEGEVKVSARGTRELVRKGLDLSSALNRCSKDVGGFGGGHNIAAGATIPKGREDEFLNNLEEVIKKQTGGCP